MKNGVKHPALTRENPNQIHRKTGISGEYRAIFSGLVSTFGLFATIDEFGDFCNPAVDLTPLPTVAEFITNSPNRKQLESILPRDNEIAVIDNKTREINQMLGYFRRLHAMLQKRPTLLKSEGQYFLTHKAELLTELAMLNFYIGPSDIGQDDIGKTLVSTQVQIIQGVLGS